MNNQEQSDLDIGIDLRNQQEEEEVKSYESKFNNNLQRNDDWNEPRIGNWNASESKKLMACDRKLSNQSWLNPDKVLAFSDGVLRFIFRKAKERETKRVIKNKQTDDMKYGTIVEGFAFNRADLELRKKGLYLEKVGYKKIPGIDTAGSSSDAVIKRISDNKIIASAEIKCCTGWDSLYDRTFDLTDEKSLDFWQTTQQMLSWSVDKNYYIVISPPQDIRRYIYAEDLDSLYDFWISETEMNVEILELSQIHANALKKRIEIAEKTVQTYIETKENLRRILYNILDEEKGIDRSSTIEDKSDFEKELESEFFYHNPDHLFPIQVEVNQEINNQNEPESIEDLDDELPF